MQNVINMVREDLPDKMLRAKDLQEIFINTSQATFDNWVRLGIIHRYKIGGGVYYKLSEVKSMIENAREFKRVG
jgi:hypothetical protein